MPCVKLISGSTRGSLKVISLCKLTFGKIIQFVSEKARSLAYFPFRADTKVRLSEVMFDIGMLLIYDLKFYHLCNIPSVLFFSLFSEASKTASRSARSFQPSDQATAEGRAAKDPT